MENSIITCENITKKFHDVTAVDNISYSFEKSKVYAIMGRSGSGKSTFLQILGLLESADSGKMIIGGKDVLKYSDRKLSGCRERYFGYIFQNDYMNPNFTVSENIMLPMMLNRDISQAKQDASVLLDIFGISSHGDSYPKSLSYNDRQLAAAARSLANDPLCILADEPTAEMDHESEVLFFDTVRSYCQEQEKCMIYVTQSTNAAEYADVILYFKNGRLREEY